MKPNPEPVLRAARALGLESGATDSLTDVEAARAAGAKVIAYANRPAEVEPFTRAGADAVITGMGEVLGIVANFS